MKKNITIIILIASAFFLSSCFGSKDKVKNPRLVMFIGVDVSGSFLKGPHFENSMNFIATYIYSHLKGYGDLDIPKALFVGSIGGAKANESKTMFPIHLFQDKSIEDIKKTLAELFPKKKGNPFTDFNAYFEQVENTVKNRKLILKPISIVLISDGKPDFPEKGKQKFRKIILKPLEALSRNITIRLLYTDAETGDDWQSRIPRKRVKIWTQDFEIMKRWKEANIYIPGKELSQQKKFFGWLKDNVDFKVRARRVK